MSKHKNYSTRNNKIKEEKGTLVPKQNTIKMFLKNHAERIITILGLVIAILTLNEMRIERNLAYEPLILLNPVRHPIQEIFEQENILEQELEDGTVELTVSMKGMYDFESIPFVNIGQGAAKDIIFTWDEDNLDILIQFYNEHTKGSKIRIEEGKSITLYFVDGDTEPILTDTIHKSQMMYALGQTEKEYELPFPCVYSIMIHEIIRISSSNEISFPPLFLEIEYSDVQNRTKKESVAVFYKAAIERNDIGNRYYEINPIKIK